MDKRFGLAVLAYLLPTFPLGYLWHLTIFADRYHELAIYREQVIIPMASRRCSRKVSCSHGPTRACSAISKTGSAAR